MAILRTVAALCFFAALTAAVPQEDAIVPETDFVSAGASAYGEAESKVKELLQSGANLDKCKELGQTTKADISASVQSQQAILDSLDDGAGCVNEGQAEVQAAQQAKEAADAAAAAAAEALAAATTAAVTLAAMPYNTLAGDTCAWIHVDPTYNEADAHYNTCVGNDQDAKATATEAALALEAAIATAARLKAECECRVQGEHDAAWTAANTDNDANSKAWTQAHNMICVADSTTYENCAVPACPVVTKPTRVSADCATVPPTVPAPQYIVAAAGTGCATGKEVTTMEECQSATLTLGVWNGVQASAHEGSFPFWPYCNVGWDNDAGTLYFNHAGTLSYQGAGSYRNICHA